MCSSDLATDLDLQVDESVQANVSQAGATTVSAHTFFDIVRKLPEGSQVELTAAEGKMQVVAGRARFNLSTLPRDDFPVIAEGKLPTRFELPAATLRQIIEKTRFAISTEETRYYLMGIFLHVVDEQLRAAATDGHRLARVTVPRPDGAEAMPDVIVPRKAVTELYRLVEELEGTVEISLSPTKIRFGLGSAILTSKLIDGTFPDYNRVIPTGNDKLLKLDPKSFSAGVDRVSTIASEKTRAVKISVDRDKVTLSVTSPENGLATEELPADYGSDGIEIGFNARYLPDILGENGAGKTNVLEAVSMLTPGRGLRGVVLSDMARIGGSGGFAVAARAGDLDIGTGTVATAPERRQVRVNGAPASVNSLSEWLSVLWLTPSMDRLFLGSAGDRRRFLDRLVLALEPAHAHHSTRYDAAMRARNKLLAEARPDASWLAALEEAMAEHGTAISEARSRSVAALDQRLADVAEDEFARAGIALEGSN